MSQFEIVKDLLMNLRKEEIRSLRRYLQLFEEGSGSNQLKSLVLLDLLLNIKNYPEEKVCKKLYGDSSAASLKTFNKILSRFKEKVYELLTLDINLFRKDSHDELNMATSEVRKMLLQVNVIEGKAPVQEVLKMYDKIKIKAKEFELYDELLLALSGRVSFVGKFSGLGIKAENPAEIMFFDRCRHSLLKAREIYSRLVQLKTGHSVSPDKLVYDQAIEELEHEYRYTKSATIGYILNDLNCHYQKAIKNYNAAEKACHAVISLISENPSVYRDERMMAAFLNLATIELLRYNFKQSESTLSRAFFYSKGKIAFESEANELTFLTLFYRGSFEKAVSHLSLRNKELSSYETAKNNYYLAAAKTLLGKTHESFLLLQQTNDLEKDQPAWNIGVRLLMIINFLQVEKFDAVESHIENLKKFIERSGKAGYNSERSNLILKLLGCLWKESFDYEKVLTKEQNNFSLLESTIPEYAWNPKSSEIIIFHIWIKSKAKHQDYQVIAEEWFDSHKKTSPELRLFD